MDCLVRGTNFLLRNIEAESFTYDHHNDKCRYHFETIRPSVICPYLLVNVGTGVSVFRVDSDDKYERVGGSSLGGGCFFGLANLLTSEVELDEMMRMAEDGDHRQFDLLVSDIYGGNPSNLGLGGDLIAASFGKCAKKSVADELRKYPDFKMNVTRSLLLMISNSIGQFAFMYGQREKTNRIYFDGFLIRNHAIIMRTISFAVEFWSEGTQQAHFLRHEGYTSPIGAYLTGSSLAGVLELECAEIVLGPFPLLAENIQVYKPDVTDLNLDCEAREFWIHTFERSVDSVIKKAVESQENCSTAVQRVQVFREKFLEQLTIIREKPFAYGNSNVRNLLDLREQLLNEQDFDDSYLNVSAFCFSRFCAVLRAFFKQKTMENAAAVGQLPSLLKSIDEIVSDPQRLFRVTRGLLAGNVFDWDRPWLIDAYDEFKSSLESKTYNCAAIFVDNSGADFILGVIPFARELLRRGCKVIMISNLSPALNDLTYREMMELVPLLRKADENLAIAIDNGRLMFEHNGQGSPCLDLRKVYTGLNRRVIDEQVDLVVIEGMGRALHTNLHAHFQCDSLKVEALKEQEREIGARPIHLLSAFPV
ncbi:unnamed protein product [Angiostrongylus costaricensis]|uniref:4'-phosphopantetheine phosphatase n=1 Tax=Angiostrongylus costaricensis TaxID=334426 RepID=A0A158PFK0_ANGCS|nr:unnamed protein product [Angiostrongylus costaricensis]